MRVCIWRGAHEIGGSCVELEAHGQRLVLDLGRPLDAALDDDVPLPPVAGLAGGDSSLLAGVISHGHPDHWGLADQLGTEVPLYMGEATTRILREARFFTPAGADFRPTGFLRDRQALRIGPFIVTPYLVDHSAFDAYALLIEAEGRRLFYSGDLRAHGRKAALVERLIADPPADVDALLLEGTNIRDTATKAGPSERDVEDQCVELFKQTPGMILAAYSGQNIDRMVTMHRAARRSGRTLVLDLYTASIAKATGRATIPQGDWDSVHVFVPLSQRIRVKQSEEFERVAAISKGRLYPEDLAARAGELVMPFRGSMTRDLEHAGCLAGAHMVWSMWPGYLDQPSSQRMRRWLLQNAISTTVLHSSGHAHVEDLRRLSEAVAPGKVVPVHTAHPERFAQLFDRVVLHADGERWDA